jgi:Ran GTPase-activating protein (RanGAP) involved in mRNA processing and transport
LEVLPSFGRLANLDLSHNKIGAEGARPLADALSDNGSLTECNVRGNHLDSESATLLANVGTQKRIMLFAIKHDQTEADFCGNGLGAADAILIASDVSVSGSLTSLNLSSNISYSNREQGPAFAAAIAEGLKVSGSLTSLNLAGNLFRAEGAKALAPAIAANGSLTSLGLSGNNIGGYYDSQKREIVSTPEGPTAIANALRVNGWLTSLNLSDNEMGSEGAKALAPGIAANGSLTSLNLAGNLFGADGAKARWHQPLLLTAH